MLAISRHFSRDSSSRGLRSACPKLSGASNWFRDEGAQVSVKLRVERDERRVDWTTFARVSDDTTNLYGEILEQGDFNGKL